MIDKDVWDYFAKISKEDTPDELINGSLLDHIENVRYLLSVFSEGKPAPYDVG